MNTQIISIDFQPLFTETAARLKVLPEMEEEFYDVYEACVSVARPKAVFCLSSVHQDDGETVIGDERDARRLLNEILGFIFFATGGEYQAMRVRSLELMSILSRAAISGGADQEQVLTLNQQFVLESDRLYSTDGLVGWLTRLITCYTGLVFEHIDVMRKDILYDAINYMKQHLCERITLEDTARQVGFSANYFSKVFKDEMGCTFNYYPSKLRIDRSKALLLSSKLSIREICDVVGYEEQSYFIKVFTRFTGVTPGKFRKRGGRLDSSKERDTTSQ